MLTADIIRPTELDAQDRAAWQALRASAEGFRSPLLGPDFAAAVGRVRSDASVAVFRRDGRAVGFLAHHRRPGGLARPIGAPFSDYHALVAAPGLDGAEALRLAGIREFRFSGLLDPHGSFGPADPETSYAVEVARGLSGGADHMEQLRSGSPKRFKNVRRLDHKLEREVGALRLIAPDTSEQRFAQLFAWKSAQFTESGLTDVFAAPWAQALMRDLLAHPEGELSGLMITLMAGEQPVAIHFGVREGERYHPWAAAHDEALSAYSPGQLFLWRAIEAMPHLGLSWYDLAGGHDHYKLPFANRTVEVSSGAAGSRRTPWSLVEGAMGEPGRRLRRRIDQIASVELTLAGRARALAGALAAGPRRAAARTGG